MRTKRGRYTTVDSLTQLTKINRPRAWTGEPDGLIGQAEREDFRSPASAISAAFVIKAA